MSDELFSLRVVVVSSSGLVHDLFRRAAAVSSAPVEIMPVLDAAAACHALSGSVDLMLLDGALPSEEVARASLAARAAGKEVLTVLLSVPEPAGPFQTDALAPMPSRPEDAQRLIEGAIRVRLPSRVLLVDDSATMRSIVRKILAATRFPLEVTEVAQGTEAIELARRVAFDIIFLDYNMPGLSGIETMEEFRREKQHVYFVLMSSAQDDAVAEQALTHGAAFLRKPFFPADIEAALCRFYGLRALNPQRA